MNGHPQPALTTGNRRWSGPFLYALAIYVVLLAGYVGLRYGFRSVEGDSLSLTRASQNVFVEGTVSPDSGTYPYGYAYPALNTFLAHATGIPVWSLQTFVQPFLVAWLVPVSYVAYRSLTRRRPVALLAALLLFMSPEFLFEATRSSHAKVTWLLALTMLFILARSLRPGMSLRQLAAWVLALYLAAYALISSSTFFASSYIFGIAFAFACAYSLLQFRRTRDLVPAQTRRLTYVTVSCLLLFFLFLFYLYEPTRAAYYFLRSTLDKLAVFLFGLEQQGTGPVNPYTYSQRTWLSPWIYLGLTSFNWIMALISFAVWLRKGWQFWFRRRTMPEYQLLLWLLYGSFGLLMVVSVLVDLSGALSANLQLRIFPHFLLVGIPLASEGIVAVLGWIRQGQRPLAGKAVMVFMVTLLSIFSLASLLKITNEPLVSNWWGFYEDEERQSVQWIADHVRNNQVWVGRDLRLPTVVLAFGNWTQQGVRPAPRSAAQSVRYILKSDFLQAMADRLGETEPDTKNHLTVYDVGDTELYYSRPRTPYQR